MSNSSSFVAQFSKDVTDLSKINELETLQKKNFNLNKRNEELRDDIHNNTIRMLNLKHSTSHLIEKNISDMIPFALSFTLLCIGTVKKLF